LAYKNSIAEEVRTVSNVVGIIVGAALILLGLILLITWWAMFIKALMAILPILLVLIGAGALAYFISEIKSKMEVAQEKNSAPEETKSEQK
jgi:multisubunit Na+/H+ antiporter MnhG subunit